MTDTAAEQPGTADRSRLTTGTLIASAVAVAIAQIGLSIPAVLNGMFQQDLGTTSTQLTWISDAFLVPITLFELSFGVVGDLFGRKRLLAIGAALTAAGALLAFFTPGAETAHGARVARSCSAARYWRGSAQLRSSRPRSPCSPQAPTP